MLRPKASTLAPFIDDDPHNFSEMVQLCRKFIGAWVGAGSDLTDDLISGFISIDSQADDVGRWQRSRAEDEADFYDTFYPAFLTERNKVRAELKSL